MYATQSTADSRLLKKRDLSILIGNAFDHFDISIYSFLAPLLAPVFFPGHDPIVQLILTYSILATDVVTRPLGAFLFGLLASTRGPNFALSYSLIGVALMTVLIGLLPSHDVWGWLSPFSLILVRMVRGVFAAGETTVARLYIVDGKSGIKGLKASYLYQSSTMIGIVFASFLSMIILKYYPESWRLCFIFGGATGFAAYFLRRFSSADFHNQEESKWQKSTFEGYGFSKLKGLWDHRTNVLRIAMTEAFGWVTYVVPFVFMNSFVPLVTSISLEDMMYYNTLLLVLDTALIPIIGPIVARFNPVHVMASASLILTLTLIPLFQILEGASLPVVLCVRTWILFWGVVFLCPWNFWCKNLFNTPDQYFLTGMGGSLGAGTIGKTLTPIFLWLWYETGVCAMPAVYMTLLTFLTTIAVQTSARRMKTRMDYPLEDGQDKFKEKEI
jgi:MFS family permease